MDESCCTYEWFMLHVWCQKMRKTVTRLQHFNMLHAKGMSHVAHMNESCRTQQVRETVTRLRYSNTVMPDIQDDIQGIHFFLFFFFPFFRYSNTILPDIQDDIQSTHLHMCFVGYYVWFSLVCLLGVMFGLVWFVCCISGVRWGYSNMGWLRLVGSLNHRSLLQNIVSFIGLFCKRDLWFYEPTIRSHPISSCPTSGWNLRKSLIVNTEFTTEITNQLLKLTPTLPCLTFRMMSEVWSGYDS